MTGVVLKQKTKLHCKIPIVIVIPRTAESNITEIGISNLDSRKENIFQECTKLPTLKTVKQP